ncbi:hypothetical protein M758_8G177200 [Ceratodon purpureus]|uniref:Uncharacterized protein n=1 Tax=Ceratodon purpureus TaxID=3225 RepID=A0A8T0H095_CERPU|nr:hypothetical protein KC19_8G182200 [Ceratodon purpureus]KAG0609340.1 hypothetical protein M758_8G177200 [Ceratodon purpureus]
MNCWGLSWWPILERGSTRISFGFPLARRAQGHAFTSCLYPLGRLRGEGLPCLSERVEVVDLVVWVRFLRGSTQMLVQGPSFKRRTQPFEGNTWPRHMG